MHERAAIGRFSSLNSPRTFRVGTSSGGNGVIAAGGAIEVKECAMRLTLLCSLLLTTAAFARDDGRYANNPLKPWFDSLRSSKGYCCSEADGRETEYDIREKHYWVPVNGVWTEVPDDAVITKPNKLGRPMVWLDPRQNIRCFIPGSGL
jgi:hypothetical protein